MDKSNTPETNPEQNQKGNVWDAGKILIVDDDLGTLELIRGVLAKAGYAVYVATNGQEGLMISSQETLQLVITDVLMPGMDGLSLFTELRKNDATKKVPILIITVAENMEESFLTLGADGFIPKPVEPKDLLDKVAEFVPRPKTIEYE